MTLDVARRSVLRQGLRIELKALDFDLLRFLVESAPDVVTTDALAEKVWGRHFVSPENVAQRVMLLRQSLAEDANRPRYVETVRSKGYRLIPSVETVPRDEAATVAHGRPVSVAAALLLGVALIGAASYWFLGAEERAPPLPNSVVVLPFEDLSPDPDDAYFAAGMQDEVVSQLTKIRGLSVTPVRPGTDAPSQEWLRGLNVASVLRGSVYYSSGRVRVVPRLTHAVTGMSLWSDSYERELSDIFAIQSEIALEVAAALRLTLSAVERERIERVPTTDPRARDLYLGARVRNPNSTPEELLLAIADVEGALAIDAEFVEAWLLAAGIHMYAQTTEPERMAEHRALAERAARRALELDPELGDAYKLLGAVLVSRGDWLGGEAAFREALTRDVSLASLDSYAFLQIGAGKFGPLARNIFEEARAADPRVETHHRFLAFVHAGLGEWSRASALYESATRLFEKDRRAVTALLEQRMHWLVGRGDLAGAKALAIVDPLNAAMLGSLDAPERALAELRRTYGATGVGNPNRLRDIGLWAGHFGDSALALRAMSDAIDQFAPLMGYVWLPQLTTMRRLPGFEAYVRDIGMLEYWREYGWPEEFCRPLDGHEFECH